MNFRYIAFLIFTFAFSSAQAGVTAYSGPSSEKLFIESAPKLGAKVFLVKIDGIESAWAGKVIKTTKREAPAGDRYSFDYVLELSTGNINKTFEMITGDGFELVKGSRIPKVQVFYSESPVDPVTLKYDEKLTRASQSM